MKTPKQILERQQKKFEEKFDQYNPIHDAGMRIPVWNGADFEGFKSFLADSHSSLLACIEEWEKEKKKEVKNTTSFYIRQRAYNQALSDLLEFLKS